jgi:hypothetical protein
MPAEIIEQTVDTSEAEDLPITEELTAEELVKEFSEPDTTADPEVDELPEKYRGKSIKDVVSMHQEAEKLIGKHSTEVGELRQMVDGYIKTNLQTNLPAEPEEPEVDFFEDPATAVSKAIQKHPDVVAARQTAEENKRATALTMLREKHPDMKEVLGDPSFATWVQGSNVRKELFQRADQNFDYDCADELISTFKERNQAVQQTLVSETAARKQQVKAAQTGGGSGANTAGAKRIYRRADIIKLMKNDPERYEALSDEIMEAYRTGRVR